MKTFHPTFASGARAISQRIDSSRSAADVNHRLRAARQLRGLNESKRRTAALRGV